MVSFGTILINISQYGPEATGPWLSYAVGVLFWIDAALAVIFSAGIYLLLYVTFLFLIIQRVLNAHLALGGRLRRSQ